MNPNILQTPIDYLKGVGPNRADLLRREIGIHTYQDLLNFFPNRYLDRTRFYKINELQRNSAEVQVVGKIVHMGQPEAEYALRDLWQDHLVQRQFQYAPSGTGTGRRL